jgi:hypothetical protein
MKILASLPSRLRLWLFLGQPAITLSILAVYMLGIFTLEEFEGPPISPFSLIGLALTFTLIGMIIASMGQFLSWALSLGIAVISLQWWGRVRLGLLLVVTPFLGILLWYGYDRFVPEAEWAGSPPSSYVHGFTWTRFGLAWLIEIASVCGYWFPLRKLRLKGDSSPPQNSVDPILPCL